MMRLLLSCLSLLILMVSSPVQADDMPVIHLSLKDHVFIPHDIEVPSGQKFKLIVRNNDTTPAEFESADLNREKVLPPGKDIAIYFDGLDQGHYGFYDDFRRDTVTGTLIAR